MTPITMNETFPNVLKFGGATPNDQVARSTATGVVAFHLVSAVHASPCAGKSYLEHLDKSHAEV